MRYVGLVFNKRSTSICVLSERGEPVQQATVRGEWPALFDWRQRLDGPFSVCYEASRLVSHYGHPPTNASWKQRKSNMSHTLPVDVSQLHA